MGGFVNKNICRDMSEIANDIIDDDNEDIRLMSIILNDQTEIFRDQNCMCMNLNDNKKI